MDIYVRNFTQDNQDLARAACDRIIDQTVAAFAPSRVERREIERGPGPISLSMPNAAIPASVLSVGKSSE